MTEKSYPLTPAQQLYADMCAYDFRHRTINTIWRLRGALDVERLANAVTEVIAANPALRMRLDRSGSVAVQRFDAPPLNVSLLDRSGGSLEHAVTEAWELSCAELDVQRDGPLRVVLTRLAEQDHLLTITEHDIVSDGWSSGLLVAAILSAYQDPGALEIAEPGYPEQVRAIVDVGTKLSAEQRAWWQEVFAEESVIPVDPQLRADRGLMHRLDFALNEEDTSALRAFGGRARATPFATVLSGIALACWQEWGQPDFRITTALAGRGPGTEQVIGLFSQLVDLRMRIAEEAGCAEFVRSVFTQARRAVRESAPPYGYTRMLAELAESGNTVAAQAHQRIVTGHGGRALSIEFEFILPPANTPETDLVVEPVDVSSRTQHLHYRAYDLIVAVAMGPSSYIGVFHNPDVLSEDQARVLGLGVVRTLRSLGSATAETTVGELRCATQPCDSKAVPARA